MFRGVGAQMSVHSLKNLMVHSGGIIYFIDETQTLCNFTHLVNKTKSRFRKSPKHKNKCLIHDWFTNKLG